jgi:hypothetical protein
MKTSLLIFLPDDLLCNIYLRIQNESKYLLNKTNYEKHYVNTINNLRKAKYNSYIRFIIRNDYSYLFDNLLKHKYSDFHIKNKISYQNITYNYLYEFVKYYIQTNNSCRCNNILINYQSI